LRGLARATHGLRRAGYIRSIASDVHRACIGKRSGKPPLHGLIGRMASIVSATAVILILARTLAITTSAALATSRVLTGATIRLPARAVATRIALRSCVALL